MKRFLAAACAATLLAASLTACSSDTQTPDAGTKSGSPSGTAYTAPGQVRSYTGTRRTGLEDGRYTAYSNGYVEDGGTLARDDTPAGDMARGARDLTRGVENAVSDAGRAVGNAARDITGAE